MVVSLSPSKLSNIKRVAGRVNSRPVLNVWKGGEMDITLFDLVLIIKDTNKPIVLFFGKNGFMKKCTYEEIATDNDLLQLVVLGVWLKEFDGVQCFYIKIGG